MNKQKIESVELRRRVLCRALLWKAAASNVPIAILLGKMYLGQTDGGGRSHD